MYVPYSWFSFLHGSVVSAFGRVGLCCLLGMSVFNRTFSTNRLYRMKYIV